ncbi:hypothetical protein VNO78_02465 [Psophocarpus tetragonolobus]|uniref:Uncharacterized protein n=1 Tax=Psophocarpus tetragonolobus TaxID=3891 RepID=A0AAN9T1F9_PSOTE
MRWLKILKAIGVVDNHKKKIKSFHHKSQSKKLKLQLELDFQNENTLKQSKQLTSQASKQSTKSKINHTKEQNPRSISIYRLKTYSQFHNIRF